MVPSPLHQDASRAGPRPPVLTVAGHTFYGVTPSPLDWLGVAAKLEQTGDDVEASCAVVREFLDLVFPPPPQPRVPWWRRWRRPDRALSVADYVAQLSPTAQLEQFLLVFAQVHRSVVDESPGGAALRSLCDHITTRIH